jgi:acylphosphatase
MRAARLRITGRVQGVGYRDWVLRTARSLGLRGSVRNRTDGSVEALIAGEEMAISAMIEACRRGPVSAHVNGVDVQSAEVADVPEGFRQLPTA